VALVALVGMGCSTSGGAGETWACAYTGKWTTTANADAGNFVWNLKWTSAVGGWHVAGDFSDKYGPSTFEGTCTSTSCTLNQAYKSGSLSGKHFGWAGTYTDKIESPTRTTNAFAGTWGNGASTTGGGAWTATAVCLKQ
jgi:hypothetical protein